MDARHSSPAILLHHDGELGDIRRLLSELGLAFCELSGNARPSRQSTNWDLVIATPRRVSHLRPSDTGLRPMLIAVLDGDSRTLRAHLRRASVDLIVRRPVHATALRLLILHAVYRGPERRDRERVSIGSDVHFRSGLLPRQAILTELSQRGCRLLTQRPASRDKSIKIYLPPRVTGAKPLSLAGTVMRCGPAPTEMPGVFVMGIRFDRSTPARARLLADTVDKHRAGPAVLPHETPRAAGEAPSEAPGPEPSEIAAVSMPAEPPDADTDTPTDLTPERRQADRHDYDKRVVALGEEATRVLLGRDISVGGMRVDPTPGLSVGDSFQLALHAMARDEPLVVRAEVLRDDGEAGLVLGFAELNPDQQREFERLITQLPLLGTDAADGSEAGVVVSQIIEREIA